MARAVARGLARREHLVPEHVGLDEKSIARGQIYATIVCDLTDGHVIDVAPERTVESVFRCFGRFSLNDLAGIKAVAMDMWQPFIRAMGTLLPEADSKIVFDRFHIVAHMNNAVDMVRRRENRALRAVGDDRLVGSKHLWLYAAENVPKQRFDQFFPLKEREPQDRARLGDQGNAAQSVGPTDASRGRATLQALVLLGDALAPPAGEEGRSDDPPTPTWRAVLLHASDHQLRERGAQLDDPDDQEAGVRLPQLRQLPRRHLVPLRRPSATPLTRATRNPEGPKKLCSTARR